MSSVDRIIAYLDAKGISRSAFYKKTGLSNGYLNKVKDLGSDKIKSIISCYPEVDLVWLVTGNGNMITKDKAINTDQKPKPTGIPLVNATAIGGFGNNHFSISESQIKERYVIPKFSHKKVDFIIEVEGSSMAPAFNSGDLVACSIVTDPSFTQYGKTHVIATINQGILIKRLRKSQNDGFMTFSSDNNTYDPFDVPVSEIIGVALVVGCIALI
jgi:repressor LexA